MRTEMTASELRSEAITRYIIPVGDPSLEKLEFSAAYIDEEIGDLDSNRFELTGGLTQGFGRWQQVLFLRLSQEDTGFPDGTRGRRAAADSRHQLCEPAAQFPDGLGARRCLLRRSVSGSPQSLGLGCVVSAFLRARRTRLADQRTVVPAYVAASSARAGSTSSPSCRPRSDSSPAAIAACAGSRSTS